MTDMVQTPNREFPVIISTTGHVKVPWYVTGMTRAECKAVRLGTARVFVHNDIPNGLDIRLQPVVYEGGRYQVVGPGWCNFPYAAQGCLLPVGELEEQERELQDTECTPAGDRA